MPEPDGRSRAPALLVDLSGHRSRRLDACDPATLDLVVGVCGLADENCPVLPGLNGG